jgi:murein DD-endopeptidase MepM/ murein hydrolase activator NlpD
MNNTLIIFFFLLLSICNPNRVLAQLRNNTCVSHTEMKQIFARIKARERDAERQKQLAILRQQNPEALTGHAFIFPVVTAPNYYQPASHYIGNYVDLNPVSNENASSLQDYNCGTRTYDDIESDYDHTGIDIDIGPFSWKMMDDNNVWVRAVEAGVIVEKTTGQWSRVCTGAITNQSGNYIALQHADNSITYYAHMKDGSLTSKDVNDIVNTGEYLGIVGSSGNSSGPHLHFEVRDENGNIIDPFQNGACAIPTGTGSLWANEEPYYNKKILSVFSLSQHWTNATCDMSGASNGISEIVNYKNHFLPGDQIFVYAAVRDATPSSTVLIKVLNPIGVQIYQKINTSPSSYSSLFITQPDFINAPVATGTYQILCTYSPTKWQPRFLQRCYKRWKYFVNRNHTFQRF